MLDLTQNNQTVSVESHFKHLKVYLILHFWPCMNYVDFVTIEFGENMTQKKESRKATSVSGKK